MTPEQRLWAAVLQRAITDMALGDEIASSWFFSEEEHIGGAEWICSHLGIEVSVIRTYAGDATWLRQWTTRRTKNSARYYK